MSGLRFKIGEQAIFAVSRDAISANMTGEVVEVIEIGPFEAGQRVLIDGKVGLIGQDADYFIEWKNGKVGVVLDWQLRKIKASDEPPAIRISKETPITRS